MCRILCAAVEASLLCRLTLLFQRDSSVIRCSYDYTGHNQIKRCIIEKRAINLVQGFCSASSVQIIMLLLDWSKRASNLPPARPRVHISQASTNLFSSPSKKADKQTDILVKTIPRGRHDIFPNDLENITTACVIAAVTISRLSISRLHLGIVCTRLAISLSALLPCKKSVLS